MVCTDGMTLVPTVYKGLILAIGPTLWVCGCGWRLSEASRKALRKSVGRDWMTTVGHHSFLKSKQQSRKLYIYYMLCASGCRRLHGGCLSSKVERDWERLRGVDMGIGVYVSIHVTS